ncbi:MAG: sodium:solute symporter family protein [FCB group bacterium]|nr:sodium:solute symporter family protein [FCB group bacterium]
MSAAWIAIVIYIIFTLIIGWFAHLHQQDTSEFWTAGRKLGPLSVGLSLSAGFMSVSWSCVYAVQLFYWYGVGAVWLITIPWLIALALIYYLSMTYHALPAFSQPEMIGNRFGTGLRNTTAAALVFVFLVWGGAEIYVAATLLAPQLHMSISAAIFMICAIVGVYMTVGGFRAVVATDKLQYVLVAVYIFIVGGLALKGLRHQGSLWPAIAVRAAKSQVSWVNLLSPGIAVIILTLVAYLPGWVFEADLWLRVQAARDVKAARKGIMIGALNGLFFVGILPMFIGIAALQLYPVSQGVVPAVIGNDGDAIFSALVLDYAPGWITLVITLGLVAAAMSTIDTCLNVMGLSISYDLFHGRRRLQNSAANKVVTLITVLGAMVFAMKIDSLWDIFYLSSGVLTTTVAFPVAAVFLPRVKARGVLLSSIFGFIGTVTAYFLESRGVLNGIEPPWLRTSYLGFILWGIVLAAIGYFIGSRKSIGELFVQEKP